MHNILNISVFNALSIGSGLVAAIVLCMKREVIYSTTHHFCNDVM